MKAAFALVALVITLPSVAQSITRLDGTTITVAEAKTFADQTLAEHNITGAQISVLNNGKMVWSYSYGLASKSPSRPVDHDTTFAAASISKSYFGTYVMQLVERGEFNVDTPVAKQLEKPLDQYDGWKTASELVKDPRWQKVTPRMLLAHTAGLPSGSGSEKDSNLHLHFAPGTQWLYSNDGMRIVQLAVEQKLHRPLDQLMHDSLFGPLGMTRTSMIDTPAMHPDVADRYDAKTGVLIDRGRPTVATASGSVTTSAEDLARFFTALYAGQILKPAARAELFRPLIPIDSVHESTFSGHHPVDAEVKPLGMAFGIGWGLLTHTKFGPAFFKEGHIDGANAYVICFDRSQSCMSILTNNDLGEDAYRPLLEHILGDTVTPWKWDGYK